MANKDFINLIFSDEIEKSGRRYLSITEYSYDFNQSFKLPYIQYHFTALELAKKINQDNKNKYIVLNLKTCTSKALSILLKNLPKSVNILKIKLDYFNNIKNKLLLEYIPDTITELILDDYDIDPTTLYNLPINLLKLTLYYRTPTLNIDILCPKLEYLYINGRENLTIDNLPNSLKTFKIKAVNYNINSFPESLEKIYITKPKQEMINILENKIQNNMLKNLQKIYIMIYNFNIKYQHNLGDKIQIIKPLL
jgi:hypothetical protein